MYCLKVEQINKQNILKYCGLGRYNPVVVVSYYLSCWQGRKTQTKNSFKNYKP